MKKILICVGLALCLPACASVRTQPPAPLKMSEGMTQDEKKFLYERHRIIKTQSSASQIGHDYYTDLATVKYLDSSGALEEVQMEKQAMELYHSGRKIEIESTMAGVALGLIAGTTYGQQAAQNGSVFSAGLLGLAVGGLAGRLLGMGLWHWNYEPKANVLFSKASESFNRQLASRLQLEINPTFSGISGVVQIDY
jgi:hypothetical protein